MRRHAPRPLANAIGVLSARLEPATPLAAVQRVWPTVVGEVIAAEAHPTAERGGVVTVSCRSAVWAQELDLMALELVDRLNAELEGEAVSRLRVTARPA
jgi:predicted nucleic acid-binding Zn ribbon protein